MGLALSPGDKTTGAQRLASDSRYGDLYESVPVMYFEMDDQGDVLSVNAFGAEQLGYEPAELVGRSVMGIFHEDDRETVAQQFRALISAGDSVASWEFRKRRKDGSVLWVRETARSICTAEGRRVVMVVCQDITCRKRAEEQRREAERRVRQLTVELDEAQERERRRIAVLLHEDVGQALAAANLKLAQLIPDEGPVAAELSDIQDLIQQAIGGTRTLTFELASPVLYELGLAEALRSLCDLRQHKDAPDFRFECPDEHLDVPERIAVPLFRIATELVFNVHKHACATQARLAVDCRDERIYLTVEDDGKGFDPEAVRPQSRGQTGIGLLSIEQRVDLLGGALEIRSEPGEGSRITVCVGLPSEMDA